MVGGRLARLSETCNSVLHVASICGRSFELDLVHAVAGLDEDDLLDALDEACGAAVIVEVAGSVDRYAFSHALIRETLYAELTTSRRVRLHRRIAGALERQAGERADAVAAQLAYHFTEAVEGGDAGKAVRYCVIAARQATDAYAYDEALRLCTNAAQIAEDSPLFDQRARADVLLARARAEDRVGDFRAVRSTIEEVVAIARELGDSDLLATAATTHTLDLDPSSYWTSVLEEALAALPPDATALRARVLADLAMSSMYQPTEIPRRQVLVSEAVTIARAVDDPLLLARALFASTFAFDSPGWFERRRAECRELLELTGRIGNRRWQVQAIFPLIFVELSLGDFDRVEKLVEEYTVIVDELRMPALHAYGHRYRAMRALMSGQLDDGRRLARLAFDTARDTDPLAFIYYSTQMFSLQRERGLLEAAIEPSQQMAAAGVPMAQCVAVLAQAESGHEDEAGVELDRISRDRFAGIPHDGSWAISVCLVADAAARIGAGEHGRVLRDLLLSGVEPIAHGSGGGACIGSTRRHLGQMETLLERYDEAERHFEEALTVNARIGAVPFVARTQCDYARMLRRRSSGDDLLRADALVAEALASAETLGLAAVAAEARALV